METVTVTTPMASPTPQKPKRSMAKKLMLSLVAVVVAGIAYVGVTNPGLFRAALLETTVPAGASYMAIPNYTAGPTDSGLIAVKVKNQVATPITENLVSLQFKLKWTPANAIVLNENSIVFDGDTLFKSADLKSVNTSTPGEALISFFSSTKVVVDTVVSDGIPLLKLNAQLNGTPGSDIVLQATDVEAIKDSSATATPNYEASTSFTAIDAGKITITTQDNLRVLNTEAIDSTHVLVRFSDLLQDIGDVTDNVFSPALTVDTVTSGYLNGYDQKTVIVGLNASTPQVSGTAYELTVGTGVRGNAQGGLDPNYTKARLLGYGEATVALSTFAVTRAVASAPDTIVLTFSEAVASGSVNPAGFAVLVDGLIATPLTVTAAVPAGNQVTLTLATPLAADKTAIVTVDATVLRASDNAVAGVNKVSVAGFGAVAGFGIVKVDVVNSRNLLVSFNANLDQASVTPAKFHVKDQSDSVVAFATAVIQPGFKTVKLTFGADLFAGVYTVMVDTGPAGILPYGMAGKYLIPNLSVFAIAMPSSALSAVRLETIDVNSSTKITLHFSGALKVDSVTPVNISIEKFLPLPAGNLTLVSATLKDPRTVEIVTAQQGSDVNYFVGMNGMRDGQGLLLGNNRVLNFFGFKVNAVVINQITPSSVTNEAERVIAVVGEHLDTVATARLGTTPVTISNKTAGALSLTVPSGFPAGNYDVNLLTQTGVTVTLAAALTVQVPVSPMRLISAESRSIPNRVAPDGTTPVKFWVLVEDPVALNQISSVTIDLEQVGGNRAQEMAKDTGLQPQYRQFYTYQTTISATTPTSVTTYKLPVQVRKGTEVVSGTVEVLVTREVFKSVAPTIGQAYITPATIAPDGEATVEVSARVTDPDGIDTISSVVADLGPLGLGFVTLTGEEAAPAVGANPKTVGVFTGTSRAIAKTVREQSYKVTVTAQDNTGASGTAQVDVLVSNSANAPEIDATKSYLTPRKSVPHDGKTSFSISAMVTNADGISEVDSVNAYFGTSGIAPVALISDPTASKEGKSALYSSGPIVIPSTVPLGVQDIEILATNKKGGRGNLILQVDVTNKDTLGEAPIIQSAKAYTTPKIALNDGKTPITLYTFVRDDDNNLESVVVNLTGIGQVGPEIPADFGEAGAPPVPMEGGSGGCPTGSNTIVCMTPSFKEGNLGQWYVLSGVTISKDTVTSVEPYKAEVIATDGSGSVTRGQIPISVRDNLTAAVDKTPLEVVAAVPVGSGTLEVVFSKPLDAMTVAGKEFGITDSKNISVKLNVLGATIDASGMVVTLTTDNQVSGTDYVLTASTKVTDSAGMALAPGRKGQANFRAFEDSDKVPVVDFIGATDGETVSIDFQANIRPSSVKMGGDFGIKISESETDTPLAVKGVRFVESGKSIEVKTEMQKSNTRYRLTLSSVESASGIGLRNPITKFFKSINIRAVQGAAVAKGADLNGDGKVDFTDFTMFSYVYGKSLSQPPVDSGLAGDGSGGLNPIAPAPDSLVPHTTPPGGN